MSDREIAPIYSNIIIIKSVNETLRIIFHRHRHYYICMKDSKRTFSPEKNVRNMTGD